MSFSCTARDFNREFLALATAKIGVPVGAHLWWPSQISRQGVMVITKKRFFKTSDQQFRCLGVLPRCSVAVVMAVTANASPIG
jgi:hypothetical protein